MLLFIKTLYINNIYPINRTIYIIILSLPKNKTTAFKNKISENKSPCVASNFHQSFILAFFLSCSFILFLSHSLCLIRYAQH